MRAIRLPGEQPHDGNVFVEVFPMNAGAAQDEPAALIYCPYRSLLHLPTWSDRRRTFERIAAALQPGGQFAWNTFVFNHHRAAEIDGRARRHLGSDELWELIEHTPADSRIDITVFTGQPGSEPRRITLWWTTKSEWEGLLGVSGLETEALYGWFDGRPFEGGSVSIENNPALLGVGYIIGPRIASIMVAGGVLAYLVLIPAIKYFGGGWVTPLAPETTHLIKDMSVSQIQKGYILYIGAGAVAAGGIISLFRSLPTIWSGLKGGLADLRRSGAGSSDNAPRTDQDLSMKFVLAGIILLMVVIMIVPQLNLRFNILGAILIIAFGFLFVTVSSRLTGEVGSSSNPISGMTVATLLLTCLVFLIIGWTAPPYFVTALSIGGIVCIAASNGGTTSQDLKTGFLVGSTPKYQQIAILVGALVSAIALGPILLAMNQSGSVYVPVAQNKDFSFPAGYAFTPDQFVKSGDQPKQEKITGGQASADTNNYYVVHKTGTEFGPPGRYLVNAQGQPIYLADPGINGIYDKVPGTNNTVAKFTAPKATLMSYIIKGILSRELPWGLVLLGVMITIVLELSGVPSLAFAVGVYLPISTSAPIFIGGAVRWLVDKYLRKKPENRELSEERMAAETDKSPGVLLASGYIAGATLAGVLYAFLNLNERIVTWLKGFEEWATHSNAFFEGPNSNVLGLIPFLLLTILLYLVGRELVLKPPPAARREE